jgi:aspartate kinase
MVVAKFGGSSLADASQVKKVLNIVMSDSKRKCIVVSAPGKRQTSDVKVTDLLIKCANARINTGTADAELKTVIDRFAVIADGLELNTEIIGDIRADLSMRLEMYGELNNKEFMDLMKAAGEDNCAKLVTAYFNKCGLKAAYINPKDVGFLLNDNFGNAQVLQETYKNLRKLKDMPELIVFPGFFGYTKNGKVITFSRGGSDITGSILAAALDAEAYENFTDVSNVYSVDPSIVRDPSPISELTYKEMRELSYAGFNVYHEDALIPVFEKGIPVHIKNTNDPTAEGTVILPQRKLTADPVVGISAAKGFMSFNINKLLMNEEIGFGRKVLQIIEEEHIPFEHVPSGIDNISVVINEKFMTEEKESRIAKRIANELDVDDVSVRRNLAMLMVVGEGMLRTVGTAARATAALARSGVNIEIINQGASEVSLMFGIDENDAIEGVRTMYNEFFLKHK